MQELRLLKVGKISIHLCCGSHIGGQKNAHQPIFPYSIIENSPTSLGHKSVFIGPNTFKYGKETSCMVYRPYQNLKQIDYNLLHQVFVDVIMQTANKE